MSKSDQGYTRGRAMRYSGGGGGRGMSESTYLAVAKKAQLAKLYLRTQTEEPTSDLAMEIKQGAVEAYNEGKNMTKAQLYAAASDRSGKQALNNNEEETRRLHEAEVLLAALESATRPTERSGLDDGEYLDDLASLTLDGSGWGEETLGGTQYRNT